MLVLALALAAHAAPVDLSAAFNADLFAAAGNDAVCLRGPKRPKAPANVTLPVGRAAEALELRWLAEGPPEKGPLAGFVDVVFADGTVMPVRATLGVDVGRGSPSLDTTAEVLGTDAKGRPVVGTAWTIPTGRPDTVVTEIRVQSKVATHSLCVTGLSAGDAPRGGLTRTDTSDWYPFLLGPTLDTPVPQAAPVEAPAGARGAVSLGPDGHLRYADGTRARFWGVNVYRQWAMPPKEDADAYAATLAALGFNLVRLHHIDEPAVGLVNPRRGEPGQPVLDPEMVDRLDFFLSRLKAHGIHLFLETATQRVFTAADGVSDPGGAPNGHKLVGMWRDDWRDAHLAWFETLWGRTNPYTKLRYADDPMVAVVELSNEHSLLVSWGAGVENLPTAHLRALDARWNAWLRERYADDAALAKAWQGGARGGLQPGESLATGTVRRDPTAGMFAGAWPDRRTEDLYRFYAGLERAYFEALAAKAKALGFRAPILPTISYGRPEVQALHQGYQVADIHLEWDHAGGRERFRRESALASPRSQDVLARSAWAQKGQAMAVSELNHPFPNPYMAEAPLLWATIASVQDWDVLVWNSWPTAKDPVGASFFDDEFSLREATVKLAQMATGSTLFRTGAIPSAPGFFPVHYSDEALTLGVTGQRTAPPAEVSELPFWLAHRVRATFGDVPPAVVPGTPAPGVGWWADPGVLVLDQATVQARVGPPLPANAVLADGAGPTVAPRLDVRLDHWAAVALASVDGKPLVESRKALLTVGTRQENTGMAFGEGGSLIRSWGVAPSLVEPARGTVRFRWTGKPVVRTLGPDGKPMGTLPVKSVGGGWWAVTFDATVRTPWLLVETAA